MADVRRTSVFDAFVSDPQHAKKQIPIWVSAFLCAKQSKSEPLKPAVVCTSSNVLVSSYRMTRGRTSYEWSLAGILPKASDVNQCLRDIFYFCRMVTFLIHYLDLTLQA